MIISNSVMETTHCSLWLCSLVNAEILCFCIKLNDFAEVLLLFFSSSFSSLLLST